MTVAVDLRALGFTGRTLDFNATRIGAAGYVREYNLDQKSYKNCNDIGGKLEYK